MRDTQRNLLAKFDAVELAADKAKGATKDTQERFFAVALAAKKTADCASSAEADASSANKGVAVAVAKADTALKSALMAEDTHDAAMKLALEARILYGMRLAHASCARWWLQVLSRVLLRVVAMEAHLTDMKSNKTMIPYGE